MTDVVKRDALKAATKHSDWWRRSYKRFVGSGDLRVGNRRTRGGEYQRELAEQVAYGEIKLAHAYQRLRQYEETSNRRTLSDNEAAMLLHRLEEQVRRIVAKSSPKRAPR